MRTLFQAIENSAPQLDASRLSDTVSSRGSYTGSGDERVQSLVTRLENERGQNVRRANDNELENEKLNSRLVALEQENNLMKQQHANQQQMVSWLQSQLDEKSKETRELRDKWESCLNENVELKSEIAQSESRFSQNSVHETRSCAELSTPESTPVKSGKMNKRMEVNALVEELRDLKSIISSNQSDYGGL